MEKKLKIKKLEVYICSWVSRSHVLFPVEYGRVVFEEGKCEKPVLRGLYFL